MAYKGWNGMPAGMSDALKGYIMRKKYGKAASAKASAMGHNHKGAGAHFLKGLSSHMDSETREPRGKEEQE
jgi:hypothetical protein